MYPCDISDCRETPGLCTYYAIASLVVVALAICLVWFPFTQLITEISLIIAKVVVYINNQCLGFKDNSLINNIEETLVSPDFLFFLSLFFMIYLLYLASGDFLISAACYISALPDDSCLSCIKSLLLEVINIILYWKGARRCHKKRPPVRFKE